MRGLEADRARFGHAVGDGDLAHVHLGDAALHHLDGARRARHDAGPERGQVEAREVRMVQFGDEHGGDAVERGAALGRHRLERGERLEAFRWEHHRRAVGDASEVPQHHAEAMIERHRNADAVALGEAHRLADEIAVIEDVVVGQRRALGGARRAAGELDIDGVVELEPGRARGERRLLARRRPAPSPRRKAGSPAPRRGPRGSIFRAQAAAPRASWPTASRAISGASARSMPT